MGGLAFFLGQKNKVILYKRVFQYEVSAFYRIKQAVLPVVPRPAPNAQMGQKGQLLTKNCTKNIIVKILTRTIVKYHKYSFNIKY